MRFDLSDEEWALLEPLLPKSRKSARVDDRKIVNAIFYVLRTGMPWRDLLLNSSTVGSTINAR
jgi:transposase